MMKVGIIGTGFIATHKHLPAWHKVRRWAKVVALCDVDRQRGEEVARNQVTVVPARLNAMATRFLFERQAVVKELGQEDINEAKQYRIRR